jgi:steroid delta-isomerase-like uncharacterized protein
MLLCRNCSCDLTGVFLELAKRLSSFKAGGTSNLMAQPNDVHRQFVEAWNKRDFVTFKSLLADSYSYTGADGTEANGVHTVVNAAQRFVAIFPDAQTKILSLYEDGDTSIGEFLTTGMQKDSFMGMPATNKTVTVQRCNIIKVRDGRIYREHDYMNMLSVLLQIGASIHPQQGS